MSKNATDQNDISRALVEVLRSLRGSFLALYRLYPSAVIALVALLAFLGVFLSQSELASQAIAVLVIFLVSAVIYAKERNYAQAILAFVVGLLPALSMSWSPGRFWLFIGGFVVLNSFFFVIGLNRPGFSGASVT